MPNRIAVTSSIVGRNVMFTRDVFRNTAAGKGAQGQATPALVKGGLSPLLEHSVNASPPQLSHSERLRSPDRRLVHAEDHNGLKLPLPLPLPLAAWTDLVGDQGVLEAVMNLMRVGDFQRLPKSL